MRKIAFLLTLITLFSCSPQRRLNRLVSKHPELVKVDTLVIRDTVTISVPSVKMDTFTTIQELKTVDTIYFDRDFVHVKVWEQNDTVYVSAKTDTIYKTVYRDIKVPCKNIVVDEKWTAEQWLGLTAFLFGLLICFIVLFRKSAENRS